MCYYWTACIALFLCACKPNDLHAKIALPSVFGDHMVLQRDMLIPVWGTANKNEILELSLNNISHQFKSDGEGRWSVTLPAMKAGGPFEITINSKDDMVKLKDVYIGEIWLCSGQSNMELKLNQCLDGETESKTTDHRRIRLFQYKKKHDTFKTPYTKEQLNEFNEGHFFYDPKWEVCSPEVVGEFSGVAYYFGLELYKSLNVPIGLIQVAVGGSPAQSWIDEDLIASHPQLKSLIENGNGKTWLDSDIIHPWLAERANENWANWERIKDTTLPGHPFAPGYLYKSAIVPLAPFAIRGAIWYQGESNATHPNSYKAMIEMLLSSWRGLWQQLDFPFYFVQLPKIGTRSLWPEFRYAQEQCLSIHNTGMIVSIDEGHPTDVHPKNKKVIGERLANLALLKTYGKNIPSESPCLNGYKWDKSDYRFVLNFDNAYEGLKTSDQRLPKGIFIQGYSNQGTHEDIITPENIIIENNSMYLSYPSDFLPVSIKYAWAPSPETNIINSSGLPLAPFKIELKSNE
jgi:sialate O-acetylesterase